jgi:hypothetical protein
MFATLNFSDIFKSSFMENISAFSVLDTIIALTLAFVIGLFIMAVYKKTFKGVMYSHSFCVSLLALNLITTLILLVNLNLPLLRFLLSSLIIGPQLVEFESYQVTLSQFLAPH